MKAPKKNNRIQSQSPYARTGGATAASQARGTGASEELQDARSDLASGPEAVGGGALEEP